MKTISNNYQIQKPLTFGKRDNNKPQEKLPMQIPIATTTSALPSTMAFLGTQMLPKLNFNKIKEEQNVAFKGAQAEKDVDQVLDELFNTPSVAAQEAFVIIDDLQRNKDENLNSQIIEKYSNVGKEGYSLEQFVKELKALTVSTKEVAPEGVPVDALFDDVPLEEPANEYKPSNNVVLPPTENKKEPSKTTVENKQVGSQQADNNNDLNKILETLKNSTDKNEIAAYDAIVDLKDALEQSPRKIPDVEIAKAYNNFKGTDLTQFIENIKIVTGDIVLENKSRETQKVETEKVISNTSLELDEVLANLKNSTDEKEKEAFKAIKELRSLVKKNNIDPVIDKKILDLYKLYKEEGQLKLEEFTAQIQEVTKLVNQKVSNTAPENKTEDKPIEEYINRNKDLEFIPGQKITNEQGEEVRQRTLENIEKILPELVKTFKLSDSQIGKILESTEKPVNKAFNTLTQNSSELFNTDNMDKAAVHLGGTLFALDEDTKRHIENKVLPVDDSIFLAHEKQLGGFIKNLDDNINNIKTLSKKIEEVKNEDELNKSNPQFKQVEEVLKEIEKTKNTISALNGKMSKIKDSNDAKAIANTSANLDKFNKKLDELKNKVSEEQIKEYKLANEKITAKKYAVMKELFASHQKFCKDAKLVAESLREIRVKGSAHANYIERLHFHYLIRDDVFTVFLVDKDNKKLAEIFTPDKEDEKLLEENKLEEYKAKKVNQMLAEAKKDKEFKQYLVDKVIVNDGVLIRQEVAYDGITSALEELDKANKNLIALTGPIDEPLREIGYMRDKVCKEYLLKFNETFLKKQAEPLAVLKELLSKPLNEDMGIKDTIQIINLLYVLDNAVSLLPNTSSYAKEMTTLFNERHVGDKLINYFETRDDFWTNPEIRKEMNGLKELEKGFRDISNEVDQGIIASGLDKELTKNSGLLGKYMNQRYTEINAANRAKKSEQKTPPPSDKPYIVYSNTGDTDPSTLINEICKCLAPAKYKMADRDPEFVKDLANFENFLKKFEKAIQEGENTKLSKDSRITIRFVNNSIEFRYNCKSQPQVESYIYSISPKSLAAGNLYKYDEKTGKETFKWLEKLHNLENPVKKENDGLREYENVGFSM